MYTYGHTLSLHDALPIPAFGCLLSGHAAAGGWCAIGGHADILRGSQQRAAPPTVRGGGARSEEHTSELQSLMRSSYAVFCLKHKRATERPDPSTAPTDSTHSVRRNKMTHADRNTR